MTPQIIQDLIYATSDVMLEIMMTLGVLFFLLLAAEVWRRHSRTKKYELTEKAPNKSSTLQPKPSKKVIPHWTPDWRKQEIQREYEQQLEAAEAQRQAQLKTNEKENWSLAFWQGISTELYGAIITTLSLGIFVLVFQQYQAIQNQKADLMLQMGSPDNAFAVEAVRQMAALGWVEDGTLRGAHLWQANLASVRLVGANLQDAYLYEADLQDTFLENANLQDAFLQDANLQQANLENANLQDAYLQSANLQQANLSNADLQGGTLDYSNLEGATLWQANLAEASLRYTNLYQADFMGLITLQLAPGSLQDILSRPQPRRRADLYKADLTGANLVQVDLENANLNQSILTGTDLTGANLVQVDLRYANLTQSILTGANLADADLWSANLQDANLENANLQNADLWNANLKNTSLLNTHFDEGTLLPDALPLFDDGFVTDEYGNRIYTSESYWTSDTDITRYTDPNHPDFWQPMWVMLGYESWISWYFAGEPTE